MNQACIERTERVRQAIEVVRSRTQRVPAAAIILGSGLGGLAEQVRDAVAIPYAEIPGFARPTAGGHRGELLIGELFGEPIVAMAGRFHRYEGHSPETVVFPVRVMAALGARRLIVSNAAGGLNPDFCVGDLVLLRDHLDWMPGEFPIEDPPGSGPAAEVPGRSGEVYDRALRRAAVAAGWRHAFPVHEGTYLATLGPNYETRAEYRMMRRVGADLVGMSTVPEVMAGIERGLRVLAVSMVSNVANPDRPQATDHEEVLQAGRAAAVKMERIVEAVIRSP